MCYYKPTWVILLIRLSDSTPLHRDNFLKLVKVGFYDSVLFHRVMKDFMIQSGDPNSRQRRGISRWEMAGRIIQYLLSSGQVYFIKKE